ncbi:hypothetical protein H0A36_22225 [Endozoicomonas sp. SM1973]|uniref:Uncharacterized protein n=1 Tax=Spartinivicinus marinus TaxID=2994442 RepID=A0A853IH11_9GAMM|nr:hypothetical protein [Spartinivicinus marinus]MCX4024786.1 hypothetical protein [Spartinivicinus marinus]NYZ68737.1 hypothetical protein [Spartinivicinus marinus]
MTEKTMTNTQHSENNESQSYSDSRVDAIAAVSLILIVVATAVFWVSGQ